MQPYSAQGTGDSTLVLMRYPGGSHRTWCATLPYLDRDFRCAAVDRPGFGEAAGSAGYDAASMTGQEDETIRHLRLRAASFASAAPGGDKMPIAKSPLRFP